MMKKIISLIMILACSFTIFFTSCESSEQLHYEKSKIVMDTLITLSAYGKNCQKAVNEGIARIEEIDSITSTSNSTGDIYKINMAAGVNYVKVHSDIIKMIQASIKYSSLSNGAFDITVGPLVNLWGIGTDYERIPSTEEIQATLQLVGYENISVNEQDHSVMLLKKGMSLDLGGIAKGFAVDEVRKIFDKYEIKNALINLGSSTIYTLGNNNDGTAWGIGITNPRNVNSENYLAIIRTSNEVLSTSGDYERYFMKEGKRYHHILDPKTGYPADNQVMSDTIVIEEGIEENGMLSDILSTIVFVLGPEKGMEFTKSIQGVSCEITDSNFIVYTSDGFEKRIENLNKDYKMSH